MGQDFLIFKAKKYDLKIKNIATLRAVMVGKCTIQHGTLRKWRSFFETATEKFSAMVSFGKIVIFRLSLVNRQFIEDKVRKLLIFKLNIHFAQKTRVTANISNWFSCKCFIKKQLPLFWIKLHFSKRNCSDEHDNCRLSGKSLNSYQFMTWKPLTQWWT